MQVLRAIRERARRLGPARVDALIAAVFLLEGVLEAMLLYTDARYAWVALLATAALAVAGAVRRRAPVASIVIACAAFAAYQPLGREINDNVYGAFFAVLFLLFSFGLHEPRGRVLLAGVALTLVTGVISGLTDSYPSTVLDAIVGSTVVAGGPVLLARVISNRSRLNATLREKTERLRRERADQAERAAAEERARIAGELHDVVAHAMSAMVVQAGGARRLAEKSPERARDAFAAVEETGREALTEIRRRLGVLRREDEEIALAPQPSLRHLDALVRRAQAAG